jgi:hypothetical protein
VKGIRPDGLPMGNAEFRNPPAIRLDMHIFIPGRDVSNSNNVQQRKEHVKVLAYIDLFYIFFCVTENPLPGLFKPI